MPSFVLVAAGGALGSVCRYLVGMLMTKLFSSAFPFGTLLVNTIGSFFVTFFIFFSLKEMSFDAPWRLFIVTGFLGGFTTFSAFSLETLTLLNQGFQLKALLNLILNVGLSLGAAWLGLLLARTLLEIGR